MNAFYYTTHFQNHFLRYRELFHHISLCIFARQLLHPLITAEMQECRQSLKYLIGLDHDNNSDNRPVPPECTHEGQRDNDRPCTDHVHYHCKFCISAATDDSHTYRHLIGHSHHDKTHDDDQLICHDQRGIIQIIQSQ